VLDVGCGEGRLSFAIAPEVRWVIGLDWDPDAIARAELAGRERGIANVKFVRADAETSDYRRLGHPVHMVVAHLCMSDAIIARAAEGLPPGAPLVFAAFHTDQWKETGKTSRFAYGEERLCRVLEEAGFSVEALEVERGVKEFASEAEALLALADLRPSWEADGRWGNYLAYLRAGGRQLTRSHLLVKARRR
jgi:SAM-dependent methyltransferase